MQFVTVNRRSGEAIPINPEMVCYMRQQGDFTTVAMANGVEHRIAISASALVEALEKASAGETVKPLEEQKRGDPPGLAAPPSTGDPAGNVVGELALAGPAPPAGAPDTGDDGLTDEEQAELAGRAQRGQEKDDKAHDDKAHKGDSKK